MAIDDWSGIRSYRPCTVTIAAPGVVSSDRHGMSTNDKVIFSSTGALPTGITIDTYYYVIAGTYSDGSSDPDTFKLATTRSGSALTTSGSQSGQQFYAPVRQPRLTPAAADNR